MTHAVVVSHTNDAEYGVHTTGRTKLCDKVQVYNRTLYSGVRESILIAEHLVRFPLYSS